MCVDLCMAMSMSMDAGRDMCIDMCMQISASLAPIYSGTESRPLALTLLIFGPAPMPVTSGLNMALHFQ